MTNGEKFKTAHERAEACKEFMKDHKEYDEMPYIDAAFHWLDLEAEEEEKPLPCPFCGAPVEFDDNCNVFNCTSCNYMSSGPLMKESAIAAHNSVAKKCMEVTQ